MGAKKRFFSFRTKPQIPLEAMMSSESMPLYEISPGELMRRLGSENGAIFLLSGNADKSVQEDIRSLSMDADIEIRREGEPARYAVYSDLSRIGFIDDSRMAAYMDGAGLDAFIQKIALAEDGLYAVTVAVLKRREP